VGVFHLCMVPATHDWMFVCRHKKLVQPISKVARHYVVGMYFFSIDKRIINGTTRSIPAFY
jgi:hypothetical protein